MPSKEINVAHKIKISRATIDIALGSESRARMNLFIPVRESNELL